MVESNDVIQHGKLGFAGKVIIPDYDYHQAMNRRLLLPTDFVYPRMSIQSCGSAVTGTTVTFRSDTPVMPVEQTGFERLTLVYE
jgi:hypothetical protein